MVAKSGFLFCRAAVLVCISTLMFITPSAGTLNPYANLIDPPVIITNEMDQEARVVRYSQLADQSHLSKGSADVPAGAKNFKAAAVVFFAKPGSVGL